MIRELKAHWKGIATLAAVFVIAAFAIFWYGYDARNLDESMESITLAQTNLPLYIGFCLVLAALLAGLGWMLWRGKKELPLCALVALCALATLYNALFPCGSTLDEIAHVQTAYRYSNLLCGQPYQTEDGSALIRREDEGILTTGHGIYEEVNRGVFHTMGEQFALFCAPENREMVQADLRVVINCFSCYVPAALGMAAARWLGLGILPMLYLGRLFNQAAFVAYVYFALKITKPRYRLAMITVALAPMALNLAGSYSYDASIIGMGALYIAVLLRSITRREAFSGKEWVGHLLLAFLLIPCKGVCAPAMLLLFLFPKARFAGGGRRKALFILSVLLAALAGFLVNYADLFSGYLFTATKAKSGGVGLLWVLNNPMLSARMVGRTIISFFGSLFEDMLGKRLSWFNVPVHSVWILLYLCCLVLATSAPRGEAAELSRGRRHMLLLTFFVFYMSVFLTMLFMWTPANSWGVVGVQGRYFLPLLPLLLLGCQSGALELSRDGMKGVFFAEVMINGFVLLECLTRILTLS